MRRTKRACSRRRRSRPHFAERRAGRQVYPSAGDSAPDASAASATATMAAVSTRRIREPRLTGTKPAASAASLSPAASPPSGPTSSAVAAGLGQQRAQRPAARRRGQHEPPFGKLGRGEGRRQRRGRLHDRNVRPPTLAGRFARDLLPARAPPGFGTRHGTRRDDRDDARDTQLAAFLDEEVHAPTARHGGQQHQRRARARRVRRRARSGRGAVPAPSRRVRRAPPAPPARRPRRRTA